MSLIDDYSDDEFDPEDLFELDYEYIEEGYHVADDLAERAVASPPPFAGDDGWSDSERYSYWQEYEDGTCGYFDYTSRKRLNRNDPSTTGQKRRAISKPSGSAKRRKLGAGEQYKSDGRSSSPTPMVLWRSQSQRRGDLKPKSVDLRAAEPETIFKGFNKRFKGVAMGEGGLQQKYTGQRGIRSKKSSIAEVEDPGDLSDNSADGENKADMAAIDSDDLRLILQQRLAEAGPGLEGAGQEMLMQYAMRMLSGGEDADDLMGELANALLGPPDQDEDASDAGSEAADTLPAWVEQMKSGKPQSTSQTPSKPKNQPPTPTSTDRSNSSQSSGAAQNPPQTELTPPAEDHLEQVQAISSEAQKQQQPQSRKRKADSEHDTDDQTESQKPKKRLPSYAAATSSSKARSVSTASIAGKQTRARRG